MIIQTQNSNSLDRTTRFSLHNYACRSEGPKLYWLGSKHWAMPENREQKPGTEDSYQKENFRKENLEGSFSISNTHDSMTILKGLRKTDIKNLFELGPGGLIYFPIIWFNIK